MDQRPDGVLLDLDGTLIDHVGAAARAVAEWAADLPGWDGDADAAIARWQQLEARHFPAYLQGACSFAEQRRRRVRAFHPDLDALDDDGADAAFADYLVRYEAHWQAFPDAAAFVACALDSVGAVGVLTNGNEAQQRRKLERTGLAASGLRLFASPSLGHAKPSRQVYLAACERLGTRPPRTTMIGDDVDADVRAARGAGLSALHLDRGRADPPPGTIASLADAVELLF
nr:HAD family hydrolase [Propionicimonas sp.]